MSFIPKDLTEDKLKKIQLEGLKWTVGHVYNHSPFYRKKLDSADIRPEDIRSLDDIQHLPLTDKDDLQKEYPFPCVPFHLRTSFGFMPLRGRRGSERCSATHKKMLMCGPIFLPGVMKQRV